MPLRFFAHFILISAGILAGALQAQENQSGSGNPFAQAKFVPDISLILDGSFNWRDLDDESCESLFLPGFSDAEGDHSA
ncbi:MAG TPA: hypothetical protein PKY55_06880, partial [bacterium]|nr:hypothetical protein [bacterium]